VTSHAEMKTRKKKASSSWERGTRMELEGIGMEGARQLHGHHFTEEEIEALGDDLTSLVLVCKIDDYGPFLS